MPGLTHACIFLNKLKGLVYIAQQRRHNTAYKKGHSGRDSTNLYDGFITGLGVDMLFVNVHCKDGRSRIEH